MATPKYNALSSATIEALKVSDLTVGELSSKLKITHGYVHNIIGKLRDDYNIIRMGKSTYHLESGPVLLDRVKYRSKSQKDVDALMEVLSAYPGEYVTKSAINEYTDLSNKRLYKSVYSARKVYEINHKIDAGYKLIGKKVPEACIEEKHTYPVREPLPKIDTSKFAEPLSVTSKNEKPVRSPVDKIMHLAMVIDEVTVDDVIDKIHIKETDVNRLMHEAAKKYSDRLVYVCELTPAKDVRYIGGFVSKEGLTELEVRAWHLVMAKGKCRVDDFAINFGMSPNDAAHLIKCVAKKFEATVTYESYIKAI